MNGAHTVSSGEPPESASALDPTPAWSASEEIRFAVVMYGGVSLAIYINGVAQELLSMVESTAPDTAAGGLFGRPLKGHGDLKGAQPVYRAIAQCAQAWRAKDPGVRKLLRSLTSSESRDAALTDLKHRPITTRFIVDILSGTSAGGINGIFLAKALANQQSMEGLKKLWVREGDLALLINDEQSCDDLPGWSVSEPQESLLNSRRMYQKLLEAFDDMGVSGRQHTQKFDSPLVGELDLFVTTTDIDGLTLPLKLADQVVYEKRHRNVFHFRYTGETATGAYRNDFELGNDPFLAYSARCTSSFPFAFEPMRLSDIDAVASAYNGRSRDLYRGAIGANPKWQKFYSEYWKRALIDINSRQRTGEYAPRAAEGEAWLQDPQDALKKNFGHRAFGDGGYLDNKPFSYATSMVARRHADVPVYRKLIYVEPSPEHPEIVKVGDRKQPDGIPDRPDFAENVLAAVLELPTKETIRDDIERVMERNAVLARISSYSRDADADFAGLPQGHPARQEEDKDRSGRYAGNTLSDLIARFGVAYGAYHRLRIDDVSGALAVLISRAAQHDPRSHAAAAIRLLVDAWRGGKYDPERRDDKTTETSFLVEFDSRYLIRRLAFVNRRINELALLDDRAWQLVHAWLSVVTDEDTARRAVNRCRRDDAWRTRFRERLDELKKEVNRQLRVVRRHEESLCSAVEPEGGGSDGNTPLSPHLKDAGLALEDLEWILAAPPGERVERATGLLQASPAREQAVEAVAAAISDSLKTVCRLLGPLSGAGAWNSWKDVDLDDGRATAAACIDYYNAHFYLYDMILFPVQYGTGSSEAGEVEIFRISPEDATALFDERQGKGRRKLAGTFLMNFGAFLEKKWRENDMLWGRLDGAERLICAVLPATDDDDRRLRSDLIRTAQSEILAEELSLEKLNEMRCLLVQCLQQEAPRLAGEESVSAALEHLTRRLRSGNNELPLAMQTVLTACLNDKGQLWEYYSTGYQVDRTVNAENAVKLMSRGTQVAANMLEGFAAKHRRNGTPFRWIATFASIFWGMVQVAVPQSIPRLFWRHWVRVLYILDVVIIVGGIVLGHDGVAAFGWTALAITFAAHVTVNALSDFIAGRGLTRWLIAAKVLAGIVVLGLLVGGVFFYLERVPEVLSAIRDWFGRD